MKDEEGKLKTKQQTTSPPPKKKTTQQTNKTTPNKTTTNKHNPTKPENGSFPTVDGQVIFHWHLGSVFLQRDYFLLGLQESFLMRASVTYKTRTVLWLILLKEGR